MNEQQEDKNLRKISLEARIPGNLAWKPAKFEVLTKSGRSLIIEVNTSNRDDEAVRGKVFEEAGRICPGDGVAELRRIPVSYTA